VPRIVIAHPDLSYGRIKGLIAVHHRHIFKKRNAIILTINHFVPVKNDNCSTKCLIIKQCFLIKFRFSLLCENLAGCEYGIVHKYSKKIHAKTG